MPVLPPPSPYLFDVGAAGPGEDLVGVGADLAPGTLLEAYSRGVFPMGLGAAGGEPLGWWSPDPRGVLRPGDLHVSRSLRRRLADFEIRVDTDFPGVVAGCADPSRSGRWITPAITAAYTRLHALGWAHSIEVVQDGALVGGLYGLAVGGLFAGESMFHRVTDASKAAVVAMHDLVVADGDPRRLIDVQWRTPHLGSLGVSEVPREEYLRLLAVALAAPLPAAFR
ncbi:MAG: leucyl/phenylalanyl-tRNA--protein transferase [Lapillicoccus sp.]